MSVLRSDSKHDCSECIKGNQIMCKVIGQEGGVLSFICCNESLSTHYRHFVSLDHPSCDLIVFKYGKGGNKNG